MCDIIFVWDVAPPGEYRTWSTNNYLNVDPLPPGWSEDVPEVVSQVGVQKLKYSCIDLEYDLNTYGRQSDWSAEEKQGAEYQELLASITARLAAAHSKSYLGT